MSTEQVELVRGLYDSLKRGDLPAILASIAPDMVATEVESLPYGGEYHGVAGFQQLLERMFATWERLDVTIEQIVADGDDVVVFAALVGKLRGVEQEIAMPLAEHWRVRDGRVALCRPLYGDTALIARLWAGRAGA